VDLLASAKKHGITNENVRHAVANALSVDEVDEDPIRYLILGPDTIGNLVEIVVLDRPNGPCVIHAMKMREKYRSLLLEAGE
jgi:transcriptional/translational regulatory protein YebC/TACO1